MPSIYTLPIPAPRPETPVLNKDGTMTREYQEYFANVLRRTGGVFNGILSNAQFTEGTTTLEYLAGNTFTFNGNVNFNGNVALDNISISSIANQLNYLDMANAPTNGQVLIGDTANNKFITAALGSANGITTIAGNGSLVVSGVNATTSNVGVASFNPAFFTVTAGNVSVLTNSVITAVVGTANRVTALTANGATTLDIAADYAGQNSITTLGNITSATWSATVIDPAYGGTGKNNSNKTIDILSGSIPGYVLTIDANGNVIPAPPTGGANGAVNSVAGTANRISATTGIFGNVTVDIDANYIGQTSITTLGNVTTGVWSANIIDTAYTIAKVASIAGTANRTTIGGNASVPTVDINSAYAGQTSITILGNIATGTWSASPLDLTAYAAGTLQAAQFPALTGDVTTSAGNLATTLATVNATTGSFGNSTYIATLTVNAKGLVTAANQVAVSFAEPETISYQLAWMYG